MNTPAERDPKAISTRLFSWGYWLMAFGVLFFALELSIEPSPWKDAASTLSWLFISMSTGCLLKGAPDPTIIQRGVLGLSLVMFVLSLVTLTQRALPL